MIEDQPAGIPAKSQKQHFKGYVWDVVQELFDYEGQELDRDFIRHPGGVSVVAVNDANEVLMIRQYRRPVDSHLWEIPAGLRDIKNEDLASAARRELIEETGMDAEVLEPLGTYYNTPGGSTEQNFIYFAHKLYPVDTNFVRDGEEINIVPTWIPMSVALAAIEDGKVKNPNAVVGILLAARRLGL